VRLAADGYGVTIASDGAEGLIAANSDPPDFIYLDLRLPKIDGLEVLERLRADQRTAGIPVVILTNYSDPELRQRAVRLGALEFMVKAGIRPAVISETVARLTDTQTVPSA
jgi:CheY-like chemotaxis protein